MGGGGMSAAAKVAGIGVMTSGLRGGAAAVNPVTFAARNAVRQASASVTSSSGTDQTGAMKVDQAVQRPVWEIDGWDFTGDEDDLVVDRFDGARPRVVFGQVPAMEEAKEATSELKDALETVYLSSRKSSGSMDSLSFLRETKACITHESSVPKSAIHAFKFLNESPAAQTVVASIACDPNVWNAVMQNHTLVEFLESERKYAKFEGEESPKSSVGSYDPEEQGQPDDLMSFIEDLRLTVVDMVNTLSNFVHSLFAVPDVEKIPENSYEIPKTVFPGGTFMALAVLVIMVIVMKRV